MNNRPDCISGRFCVCGAALETFTGGYACQRCYRRYGINGKEIGRTMLVNIDKPSASQRDTEINYGELPQGENE